MKNCEFVNDRSHSLFVVISPRSHIFPKLTHQHLTKFCFLMKKILLLGAGLVLAQTALAQNGAEVVSISAPASVAPGATFTATITMKNTGATAWTTAGMYALGSESPRNNLTWLASGRVAIPGDPDPIDPGETAAFTTTFTAPTTPGVYHFTWGMVQDTIEWFGQIASQTIRVGNGRFTPGDLVVMQVVATASDSINANGTALVLKNFSPSSSAFTFEVDLPFTGADATVSGTSPFTGMIDLSTDRNYVVVGGYNQALPNTSGFTVEAATSPHPRVIGTVNSGGQYVLSASTTPPVGFSGATFRGVVSDGQGNFWGGGQNSGIYYFGNNFPPGQISSLNPSNVTGTGAIRNMIMVNGRPYFSTSQFPAPMSNGIAAFPSVAPTSPEEPVLVIDARNQSIGGPIAGTGNPNIKGFCVNTNLTIAYVVDMRTIANGGGIYRYNGDGSGTNGSWTYQYTIINNLFADGGAFQEIVADFSGANPILYATAGSGATFGAGAGTNLVSAIDTGAATTFTLLATTPITTPFRGLTFAPNPVSLSITRSAANVIISWNGGGTLRSASVVTGPYLPVAGSPTSPYTNAVPATMQFYGVGFP